MELKIINLVTGDIFFEYDKEMPALDRIRAMTKLRNFLKKEIDRTAHEIVREQIENSGQISIEDVIKEEENNQNTNQ